MIVPKLVPDPTRQHGILYVGDEGLQLADISGKPLGEIVELIDQDRNEDHQRQREDDDEGDQDADCCHQAAEPQTLQTVGHGIKEIGDRHAGDKGQQDGAEDIEKDDEEDEHAQPEEDLPFETCSADLMWHRFPRSSAHDAIFSRRYSKHIGCGPEDGQPCGGKSNPPLWKEREIGAFLHRRLA